MTDPKPITAEEAGREIAAINERVARRSSWLLAESLDAELAPERGLWQRILATAHQAEQRWVPVSENTVALAKFTAWVLEQAGEGREVYGEDAQDYAVKLGLLTPTVMDAPCGEICPCAEVGEFPLKCNRFSDALQSALPPQPEV